MTEPKLGVSMIFNVVHTNFLRVNYLIFAETTALSLKNTVADFNITTPVATITATITNSGVRIVLLHFESNRIE